jgi:hypothetical protein
MFAESRGIIPESRRIFPESWFAVQVRLKGLEEKLVTVQKKLSGVARLERLKKQSEECAARLAGDITAMKKHRVDMLRR